MSIFKNRATGDIVTAFGAVHDWFAGRADHELVSDDRDGTTDAAPQPEVLDEPASTPEDTEGSGSSDSQNESNPADAASDNSRSTK